MEQIVMIEFLTVTLQQNLIEQSWCNIERANDARTCDENLVGIISWASANAKLVVGVQNEL